jgi:hypothetical protein
MVANQFSTIGAAAMSLAELLDAIALDGRSMLERLDEAGALDAASCYAIEGIGVVLDFGDGLTLLIEGRNSAGPDPFPAIQAAPPRSRPRGAV